MAELPLYLRIYVFCFPGLQWQSNNNITTVIAVMIIIEYLIGAMYVKLAIILWDKDYYSHFTENKIKTYFQHLAQCPSQQVIVSKTQIWLTLQPIFLITVSGIQCNEWDRIQGVRIIEPEILCMLGVKFKQEHLKNSQEKQFSRKYSESLMYPNHLNNVQHIVSVQ